MNPDLLFQLKFDLAQKAGQVIVISEASSATFTGIPSASRLDVIKAAHRVDHASRQSLAYRRVELSNQLKELKRQEADIQARINEVGQALAAPNCEGSYTFEGALVSVAPMDSDTFVVLVDTEGRPILETARPPSSVERGEAMRALEQSRQLDIEDAITPKGAGVVVEVGGEEIPFE